MFTFSFSGPFYVPDLVTLLLCWVEVGLKALKSTSLFKGKCCICKLCRSKGRQYAASVLCIEHWRLICLDIFVQPDTFPDYRFDFSMKQCNMFVNAVGWLREEVCIINKRVLILFVCLFVFGEYILVFTIYLISLLTSSCRCHEKHQKWMKCNTFS